MTTKENNEIARPFATSEALETAARERDALADAAPTVGPGFKGALGYYLAPTRFGDLSGRATRKEYWGFLTCSKLLELLLRLSAFLLFTGLAVNSGITPPAVVGSLAAAIVELLWFLIVLVPSITVVARRMHDLGFSAKRLIAPNVLMGVGYGLFIAGIGGDAWLEEAWTWSELPPVALCGAILSALGTLWCARYGIPALCCRGEAGANRWGGERLNPTPERPFVDAPRKICPRCQAKCPAEAKFCDICESELDELKSIVATIKTLESPEAFEAFEEFKPFDEKKSPANVEGESEEDAPFVPTWGEAIGVCFSKFFTTSGRASRPEFWYFVLTRFLLVAALLVGIKTAPNWSTSASQAGAAVAALKLIRWGVDGLWLIPSLTCAVRRLQDSGRSGANIYWIFVPILGWAILLFQLTEPSEEGTNRFGRQPVKREDVPA